MHGMSTVGPAVRHHLAHDWPRLAMGRDFMVGDCKELLTNFQCSLFQLPQLVPVFVV